MNLLFPFYLFLVSFYYRQRGCTSIFFSLLRLILWVNNWFVSKNAFCALEKKCVFCICLLGLSCASSPLFSRWLLVWLSIVERGVEEFLITILLSISPFSSLDVCFIYLFTAVLGICPFTAMISSWWSIFVFCHGFVHT